MLNIPIVVAAFNRKHCLNRLLQSLSNASYPCNVKLIISIDGGGPKEVLKFANDFTWPHGEKEVISHKDNLGLRKHIISCGNLSNLYDGIILLEDDLYVAPYFYQYTQETQSKYAQDKSISGIALYSHQYNETACLPFIPIQDQYDVFFMQLACSWGQCWLTNQWGDFIEWYNTYKDNSLSNDPGLPNDIRLWPDTSWKKFFIKYMILNNKYFVYPRTSFTTNFGDTGQHHQGTKLFQVPLQLGYKKLKLPSHLNSLSIYDAYCEISPKTIKHYNKSLREYDFEVDMYGIKEKKGIKPKYALTKQKTSKSLLSFGCEVKPQEMNVFENIPGAVFHLTHKQNIEEYTFFLSHRRKAYTDHKLTHKYFYQIRSMHYEALTDNIIKKDLQIEELKKNHIKYFIRLKRYTTTIAYKIYNKILKITRKKSY